ncbi:peptidase S8/S53 domain-containing protein [Mycena albidolilacea]|uniref:Peptidase S8/S53 domain-containing protein n=1 Tax=Mycena albidolilacea TaxID=1033008 RepID=A0AAD7ETC2_9AGAR|nr:peptidase S8/S53 domain-containing protein [Mycena albidolilacea]
MASSFFTLALSLAGAVSSTPLSTSSFYTPAQRNSLTPAPFAEHQQYGHVNNSYIVVLKKDAPSNAMQNQFNFLTAAHQEQPLVDGVFGIKHVYPHINGYAGHFSPDSVEQLRAMPEVDFIERDQIVRIQDVQKQAPWGLARVSHRSKLTFATFKKYEYDSKGGEGVDVYVIDTGINVDHVEFGGRASWGHTVPDNDVDEDGNGHGTHCAGTIASRKYGVAKAANVIAVKVLGSNGSGSMSDVVAGVAFAANAASKKAEAAAEERKVKGKSAHKGSVANMSLGGGKSAALDRAVNAAVDGGLHFAVAAGNDNRDACNYSPAAAEKAVTVGASSVTDERAYFSNHGKCVDVFAPGLSILSTWIGSEEATNTISGTSMASPHTAGLLAYLLSLYPSKNFNPDTAEFFDRPLLAAQTPFLAMVRSSVYTVANAVFPGWLVAPEAVGPIPKEPETITPPQLKRALLGLATKGALVDKQGDKSPLPAGSPNLLIFNNFTADAY